MSTEDKKQRQADMVKELYRAQKLAHELAAVTSKLVTEHLDVRHPHLDLDDLVDVQATALRARRRCNATVSEMHSRGGGG